MASREYICKEVPTENGGYLEIEKELIRCKDCAYYSILGECYYLLTNFEMDNDDYCSNAMLKEEHEKEEDKGSD